MPNTNPQRVYDLLHRMPTEGLNAAKRLFWTELNYDRAADTLSTRDWPAGTRALLAADPTLLAQHSATLGNFDVVYIPLASEQTGRSFPLSLAAERAVIAQLLPNHPYALFIFSDAAEKHWHIVNVKYRRDKADGESIARRVLRRIAIGPHERLRTAAERIAMLDLTTLSPNLFGLSPIAIQQRHDDAFDVEAVTKAFFTTYREHFERVEARITGLPASDAEGDVENVRIFTQRLFNRLLFIIFLERKGWLIPPDAGKSIRADGYLAALWDAHRHPSFHSGQAPSFHSGQAPSLHSERHSERSEESQRSEESNFYRDRLKLLFFSGLNNPGSIDITGIKADGPLAALIGCVPYLNGGLFEKEDLDERDEIAVPDAVFGPLFNDLLYHYNFTVTESTPLDVEVAVDPEMLGKIFEELVTGRHETGSYYTPKPVVAFMCREALKGYLRDVCPREFAEAITAFVEECDPTALRNPEAVLEALKRVKVCDPACGSGAYLLGMLHELLDLRLCIFAVHGLDAQTLYRRKLKIIQNNLYGVDVDPFAVNIARLRLWLSLIVDYDGDDPPPLPNLNFKIEVGDSLTSPDPQSSGSRNLTFYRDTVDEYYDRKTEYLMLDRENAWRKAPLEQEIMRLRHEIAKWAGVDDLDAFDWAVDFAEVFIPGKGGVKGGGFDIVVANPPYVRADAQFKHLTDETERQAAIAQWSEYRKLLKARKLYTTLYQKWDLFIPFLERAYQLLCPGGQMVFIISDAINAAKYAEKSHRFFLDKACIARLDFCSEIPLFKAGVNNTIAHFVRTMPTSEFTPRRFRRWGDTSDDFDGNCVSMSTKHQVDWGREIFRPEELEKSKEAEIENTVPLVMICYISVGMVIHAHEKKAHLAFGADDLISEIQDDEHPKPFVEGKDLSKWRPHCIRFLEYGTPRAPALFRRPTFPELYEVPEKLISKDLAGDNPDVIYDDCQLIHNHSAWSFVPWHYLNGIVNTSISKTAKYRRQTPEGDREERERISHQFDAKYLLAIMNSSYASKWLAKHRQSKIHIYPNDWKQLPIALIPLKEQEPFVQFVDAILAEFAQHGVPLPPEAAAHVAAWEAELNALVYQVYKLEKPEIALIEGSLADSNK